MEKHYLYTNRLINEKSPYLLQHAHNPVDWHPWGEEAFHLAKELDKPIFLSIGYATCHWCHVMERETFENVEVAQLMNDTFINIKVDREEHPEVDNLYMEFAQSMMAGAAGWPLNLILTPSLKPFFATTYLPPLSSHGLMGLTDLVQRIAELWDGEEREKIIDQSEKVVQLFQNTLHTQGEEVPSPEIIHETIDAFFKMADPVYGGIKGAPKFPIGYQSSMLMRYYVRYQDNRALYLAEKTLDMMHRGGIYDHLGGGFSRYSVDEQWLIPHFEKMLYDNAILAQSYLEAYMITKKPQYKKVCEEILNYVLRDMTHSEGGFYSAEDADSEGHEGLFYTWTYDEVEALLGKDAELFCRFYGITKEGNFEGRNVLHTTKNIEEFAGQMGQLSPGWQEKIESQKKLLWKAREKRIHPFKDDKVLSAWNGMMIFTLAKTGFVLNDPTYLDAAIKAATFLKEKLWKGTKLLRRWRDGEAMFDGGLDEYANVIRGVLAIYEATGGSEWLAWAIELTEILKRDYKSDDGAFYQTDGKDSNLILRKCQFSDGAEPSGNAIHTENLLRLYQITNDMAYLDQIEDVLRAVDEYLINYSPGYCYHMMNLIWYYDDSTPTFVVAFNERKSFESELKELFAKKFLPHESIVWNYAEETSKKLPVDLTLKAPVNGKTTLYVCFSGRCQEPMNDFIEMKTFLENLIHTK